MAHDARGRFHAVGDGREDRVPGAVTRVNDAPGAVPPFARQLQVTLVRTVEGNVQLVQQQFADRQRTLAHQLSDGRRVGGCVAGFEDIALQQLRLGRGVVDDASLRPVAVGFQRPAEGQQGDVQPGAFGI